MFEQKSEEWYKARAGHLTGSSINKLLTKPRGKEDRENGEMSATTLSYLLEKVGEILTGLPAEGFDSKACDWGNEYEPLAGLWYKRKTGNRISPCSFIKHTTIKRFGASPDGKVTEEAESGVREGGLEIKCPYNTVIHLQHCLINSLDYFKKNFPDKYWQCVSEAIVLKVDWIDFVSFDPRIDADFGFFCFRVQVSLKDKTELLEAVMKAEGQIESLLKQFTK
jgi:hypothetical protein